MFLGIGSVGDGIFSGKGRDISASLGWRTLALALFEEREMLSTLYKKGQQVPAPFLVISSRAVSWKRGDICDTDPRSVYSGRYSMHADVQQLARHMMSGGATSFTDEDIILYISRFKKLLITRKMRTYLPNQSGEATYYLEDVYFALLLHPFHDAYYAKRCKEEGVQTLDARARKSLLLATELDGGRSRKGQTNDKPDAYGGFAVVEAEGNAKGEVRIPASRAPVKRATPKLKLISKSIDEIKAETESRKRKLCKEVRETSKRRTQSLDSAAVDSGQQRQPCKKMKKNIVQILSESRKKLHRDRKQQQQVHSSQTGLRVNAFRRKYIEKERIAMKLRREKLQRWAGRGPEDAMRGGEPSRSRQGTSSARRPPLSARDSLRTVTSSGRTQSAAATRSLLGKSRTPRRTLAGEEVQFVSEDAGSARKRRKNWEESQSSTSSLRAAGVPMLKHLSSRIKAHHEKIKQSRI